MRYGPALTGACRQDCQVEFDLPDLQGCIEVTDSDPGALQTTGHAAPHPRSRHASPRPAVGHRNGRPATPAPGARHSRPCTGKARDKSRPDPCACPIATDSSIPWLRCVPPRARSYQSRKPSHSVTNLSRAVRRSSRRSDLPPLRRRLRLARLPLESREI